MNEAVYGTVNVLKILHSNYFETNYANEVTDPRDLVQNKP